MSDLRHVTVSGAAARQGTADAAGDATPPAPAPAPAPEETPTVTITQDATGPAAGPGRTRMSTVYLLQDTGTAPGALREALNPKYERDHGFVVEDVRTAGVPAVLCHGGIGGRRPPDWATAVDTLTGRRLTLHNHNAACVLLLPVDGDVFALTFGLGHLLLEQDRIAPGFGFDFVLRTARPDAIRHVTHSLMDARGRTDRSSAATGQPIRTFAIEHHGEVVSRLVGAVTEELDIGRGRRRTAQVAGADSLKMHLSCDPDVLLKDLAAVRNIVSKQSPHPDLEAVAQVRPLRPRDPRCEALDAKLDALLGADGDTGSLALTVPMACLDQEDAALSYRVKVGAGRREVLPHLELDAVLNGLADVPPGGRLAALRSGYVQMCRGEDGSEPFSSQVKAHKWLAAEVSDGSSRYFRREGRWYVVGGRYAESVGRDAEDLLAAPAGVALFDWTSAYEDERTYNEEVADEYGHVCLDRKLIRTRLHPHGIEAADLLTADGTLVHVKRAESSAPLSHLFAQGRVSAEALRLDADARAEFVRRVRSRKPDHPIDDDFTPTKVVYAISLKSGKPLTARNLFTFAQVSLLQAARALRAQGIEVAVVDVPTVKDEPVP